MSLGEPIVIGAAYYVTTKKDKQTVHFKGEMLRYNKRQIRFRIIKGEWFGPKRLYSPGDVISVDIIRTRLLLPR
jgi:hypothetical protein